MDKKAFCNQLADLGLALKSEGRDARLRGLAALADLGVKLQAEDVGNLEAFVSHFLQHPDRLKWELLGQSALRRRELSSLQRRQLDILGWTPDLLEPLRSRWDERSHTEVIAWLLDPARTELGGRPLEALLERVGILRRELGETEELPFNRVAVEEVSVRPEVSLPPYGRVDIQVSTPRLLLLIEAKVFAPEGRSQLDRYEKAAKAYRGNRASQVIFLTADPDQEPSLPVPHVTFSDLLLGWLPIATAGASGAHVYLGRYLASIARVLGVAHPGDFDDWSFSARRRALDFITEEGTA